ncbi:MAG TPA: hypothetical protein VK932_20170 [Kofleriaceae bacterium]|nr:hypothetical protein [Kofleriaceae bacterium]
MSKRGSPLLIGVLAVSCYTSAPAPPMAPVPAGPVAEMTIQAGSIGPITGKTPGSLIGLRRALPGYDVKPAHLMLGPSTNRLGFNVYKDGEKLLHVLPDGKGGIFSVHAVSPKIVAADRPWKTGAKLNGVRAISTCRCWEEEVVVCFKAGDHVAISFARECGYESYSTDDERQDLIGVPIQRVLWSPKAFGEESNPYGGDEYGGDEYGDY